MTVLNELQIRNICFPEGPTVLGSDRQLFAVRDKQ